MAIKPILFNTEMVRAILDGKKTCTRRIVKGAIPDDAMWGYTIFTPKGCISCRGMCADEYGEKFFRLPYQQGDILYVRETWYYESHMEDRTEGEPDLPSGRYSNRYVYKADCPTYPVNIGVGEHGWKPSIHMPKEAARIWLKVKDVRAERLQDITIENIKNEGVHDDYKTYSKEYLENLRSVAYPKVFSKLWDFNIKKSDFDRYGWNANPWVWVIEFERCEKPKEE